jgi:CRP-like cAMP-binding protein
MTVVNPMTRLPALRPVSIFRGLSKQALFSVARKATEITYPAGTTVVSEGDPGDSMGVIIAGAVDVCKGDHVVAKLAVGEYFGELALIDGEPRTATVVATEDLTLLTVTAEDFDALLTDPYFARAVMRNLAQRFREVQDASLAARI